jgi:hypothetical protein
LYKVAEIRSHGEYSYHGSGFITFEIRNPASKSLQSIEISLYLAFTNE